MSNDEINNKVFALEGGNNCCKGMSLSLLIICRVYLLLLLLLSLPNSSSESSLPGAISRTLILTASLSSPRNIDIPVHTFEI